MTQSAATPQKILDIATGYMAAKQLFAAARVGVFGALADGPKDVAAIAQATGTTERIARILADTMNSLELLDRTDGRYSLAADSAEFLSGAGDLDLTDFLGFLNTISYRQWLGFDATVDSGEPGKLDLDPSGWGAFMAGVMKYNALHATRMATVVDYSGFHSLLDLGGLSPAFAVEAMKANEDLAVTFVYDPGFTDSVTEAVTAAGLADRATVEGAATDTAEPTGPFDAVMVNHVIHRFTAEQNIAILTHARAAAAPGATLFMLDFYLDDDARQRRLDAVHAGEYYVIDGTAVWPIEEAQRWLAAAGWRFERLVAVPGSPRALVATAV